MNKWTWIVTKENTMKTIPLPEEPPVGSTAMWTGWNGPRTATRNRDAWRGDKGRQTWASVVYNALVFGSDLTVTTPLARTLPTHDGAFIEASGTNRGERFQRTKLFLDGGVWWSLDGYTSVHPTPDDDTIDPDWTELVLVAKDEHEKLTSAIERVRKVIDVPSTVVAVSTIRAALDGPSS